MEAHWRFEKKSFYNFQNFWSGKCYLHFHIKSCQLLEYNWGANIFELKRVLEYVELVGSEPKYLIHDNEGHSNV